jgi:hypothetical protein
MSKQRLGTQRYSFSPFEDESHLECICRLALRGRNVGAYLLKKRGQFTFVFGFRPLGIHTLLAQGQAETVLGHLEEGLKGFRPGDLLRIHLRSFAEDMTRQQELDALIQSNTSLESQFLLMAQQRAVREMTSQGLRQPKQIYMFASHTVESGKSTHSDHTEKVLAWFADRYDAFKGAKDKKEQQQYLQLLNAAFTDGYLHWEQQINSRMGLQAAPMGADHLWEYLEGQFNHVQGRPIPQCLSLTETPQGLVFKEEIKEELHAASVLIRGENGRPSHPKADRQWVKVKDQFVGAVVLESKPMGFTSPEHQLYFLWQALSQFSNCEFICELAAADRTMTRMTLQRLTKQNLTATYRANLLKNVDVASQMRMKQGVEAQEQIYQGALPIWVGVVVLIHEKSPENLAEACQKLTNTFHQGEFIRETEVAWSLWLRSLPIVKNWLLGDGRKQLYLTNEAPGLMPIACPRQIDGRGIELITHAGNMPVQIDFAQKHRGILIFGETRSGKSVLAAEIFVWAIANGMNVISLDYPKPDGTTTYTDLVKFFGDKGAYFDVGSETNNLFQIPDLRHLPEKQQEERLDDYKEFLVKALDTMVMGADIENAMGKRVHTILWQALAAFFDDAAMMVRYDAAFERGFGSAEWQQMPTLVDFIDVVAALDLGLESDLVTDAIATILLRLRRRLSSRIGHAISKPSAFAPMYSKGTHAFPASYQLLLFDHCLDSQR